MNEPRMPFRRAQPPTNVSGTIEHDARHLAVLVRSEFLNLPEVSRGRHYLARQNSAINQQANDRKIRPIKLLSVFWMRVRYRSDRFDDFHHHVKGRIYPLALGYIDDFLSIVTHSTPSLSGLCRFLFRVVGTSHLQTIPAGQP